MNRRTILALPLASGGRAQGVVVLGNPERPFDAARSRLAETVCSMAAIAIDNVLWHARVIDPNNHDEDTIAIRAFNQHLRDDSRVHVCMLPFGDGLTLAVKR